VTVRGYNGLTHWAFGQLARIAGAPAEYLRSLPANIVVDAVTHGLKNPTNNRDEDTRLLVDRYEHDTIRAMTSTSYTRIFNADITGRLLRLAASIARMAARARSSGRQARPVPWRSRHVRVPC